MCLNGKIDAIYHTTDNQRYILRGRHAFRFEHSFETFNKTKPTEKWSWIWGNRVLDTEGYYSASFRNSEGVVLVIKVENSISNSVIEILNILII